PAVEYRSPPSIRLIGGTGMLLKCLPPGAEPRAAEFRCTSAVRPFNSPDRPQNSAIWRRSGILVRRKWNQQLARSHSACEGRKQACLAVFPRRTGELPTRYQFREERE